MITFLLLISLLFCALLMVAYLANQYGEELTSIDRNINLYNIIAK